jgi:chromosome segregation ATPase
MVFFKNTFLVASFLCSLTSLVWSQSDLSKLRDLVDQEKSSSLKEIKQLREKHKDNPRTSGLFDFAYALSAIKFGRLDEAIGVLQPFVDKRPQVVQARLLLLRAHIEKEQFDKVLIDAEKLLDNFPANEDLAERVASELGTLVGYLNFARPDFSDDWKIRLERLSDAGIPESMIGKYRESISLVEARVASIREKIAEGSEKDSEENDEKVSEILSEVDELREESKKKNDDLKSRESDRAQNLELLKSDLKSVITSYNQAVLEHARILLRIDDLNRRLRSLEREVKTKDRDGNETTRTEITNRNEHNRIEDLISQSRRELFRLENEGATLQNQFLQLRATAQGLLTQQQLDAFLTNNNIQQLDQFAETKEKKAVKESDRKGKKSPAVYGLSLRLRSYSTYKPFDFAWNQEYLQEIVKRSSGD